MNLNEITERVVFKRTFAAARAFNPTERAELNRDVITSEYYASQPWLVREYTKANPVQPWFSKTFRTKREAIEYVLAKEK